MIERVVGNAGGAATGAVLAAVSAARRDKAVHPKGVVCEAVLSVPGDPAAPRGARLLSQAGEHRALVRFSRALGLPAPLPDVMGIAIRVLDAYGPGAHHDLLMVSSADAPVLHHALLPATHIRQRPLSTLLPYRAGADRVLLGALPAGERDFDLAVAPPRGRFSPVARLKLGARLPEEADDLRFDVRRNCGGGLEPVGIINRMRDLAYPMSQWAWTKARTLT